MGMNGTRRAPRACTWERRVGDERGCCRGCKVGIAQLQRVQGWGCAGADGGREASRTVILDVEVARGEGQIVRIRIPIGLPAIGRLESREGRGKLKIALSLREVAHS